MKCWAIFFQERRRRRIYLRADHFEFANEAEHSDDVELHKRFKGGGE